MADFTVSRIGDINSAGSPLDLFLKIWSGEVLATYDEINVMMDKHSVRSIKSGKSAQFPVIGRAAAAYHVPGVELAGTEILHNEKVINIDGKLLAHTFLADIDEAMNHYDVRAPYTRKLAEALSVKSDKQLLQLVGLAARAAATITGLNGGSQLTNANYGTVGADLAAGIFSAAQTLDEKDVPESERYCALRPAQYYLLTQNTNLLNRDWGGSGVYSEGKIFKIAGISLVKSNHVPISNISADTGTNNTYHANFTNTKFLVWHREAVGTVKLMDLRMQAETTVRHQGTLIAAGQAIGHGILRPECAVEGITA